MCFGRSLVRIVGLHERDALIGDAVTILVAAVRPFFRARMAPRIGVVAVSPIFGQAAARSHQVANFGSTPAAFTISVV